MDRAMVLLYLFITDFRVIRQENHPLVVSVFSYKLYIPQFGGKHTDWLLQVPH